MLQGYTQENMWHVRSRGDVHRMIWSGCLRESGQLEHLGLDWKIVLKWVLKKSVRGLGGIGLVQDRDTYFAAVNEVIKLDFYKIKGI